MWLFAGDAELADAAAADAAGGTDDLGGALGLDDPSAVAAGAGAIIGDAGAAAAGAIIGALANGTAAAAGLGLLGAANATGAGAAAAGALGAAPTCAPKPPGLSPIHLLCVVMIVVNYAQVGERTFPLPSRTFPL